jgi:hypothetical protein
MSRIPLTSVIPPGGHHFIDRSGGEPFRIDGDNLDDVAKKVLKHRLDNGRPPGDPMSELIDYVCGTWPHFCRETEPAALETPPQRRAPLATRCASWIARFYAAARADAGVSRPETERRANICASCPQNTVLSGCGSCIENIERVFFIWRRDRALPRERELHACHLIGQHNGAAALAAELPSIDDETRERLPANCWRK